MKTVKQALIEAKALISDPNHWCKGTYTEDGPCGTQYCTLGAASQATLNRPTTRDLAWNALHRAASAHGQFAHSFNDLPSTTHADIMALFDRAIASCE